MHGVSMCTHSQHVDCTHPEPQKFKATWLDGMGTPAYGRTMQQYHQLCSYGKVRQLACVENDYH